MMESCLTDKRIGVIGGSFDPLHLGHLTIAQDAAEYLDLSEVIFIPAAQPPHKQHIRLADAVHRLTMLEQALASDERFSVSDIELIRDGLSYSVDTVRELCAAYPNAALFLIIGSDTLVELHTWYRIEELLTLCNVATVVRPGIDVLADIQRRVLVPEPYRADLLKHIITTHPVDISSTEIRRRIAEGKSISNLVPAPVATYITENNLYQE